MKISSLSLVIPLLMGGVIYSGAAFAEHTGQGRFNNEDLNKVETPAATAAEPVQTAPLKPIPQSPDLEAGKLKESVAAQKRINRYFHTVVVPALKACWEQVKGRGTIEMQYRYEADARGEWVFKELKAGRSTLPQGQNDAALACMQKAAAGTAFPKEGDRGNSYLLDWTWPVPLPPDADRQVERMVGAGGGEGAGCDGHGAPARCLTCSGSPLTCVYVCVGSETCSVQATHPGGFDSICSEGGSCASGGPFGVVGGIMMY